MTANDRSVTVAQNESSACSVDSSIVVVERLQQRGRWLHLPNEEVLQVLASLQRNSCLHANLFPSQLYRLEPFPAPAAFECTRDE